MFDALTCRRDRSLFVASSPADKLSDNEMIIQMIQMMEQEKFLTTTFRAFVDHRVPTKHTRRRDREEEEVTSWRFKGGKREVEALVEDGGAYHAAQRLLRE
jgi:hypothetical protein